MRHETISKVLNNKSISESHKEIYSIIAHYGPINGLTVKKVCNRLHDGSETVRNRITELKKMGLVKTSGKSACKITKRLVFLFEITERSNPILIDKRSQFSIIKQENGILKRAIREVVRNNKITNYFNELISSINL